MLGLVKDLKIKFSLQVQYLLCNNAGENQAFKKTCKQEGLGINFKCTAPGMPQQNGCIEHKFAILVNWVQAMLDSSKYTAYLQSDFWAEAANTTTLLKINLITPNRTLSAFQHFFGKEKKLVITLMQKFGEICIAANKDNTHGDKQANCGTPGIWISCTENHLFGTYRIFNPKTKKLS